MKYFRVATVNTPEITFDLNGGFIGISGKSTTVNSVDFHKKFIVELIDYRDIKNDIHLDMGLDLFNTSSAKCLYDVFKELKKRQLKGNGITINWFYNPSDKDMLEMGQDFSELIEIEFDFIPTSVFCF